MAFKSIHDQNPFVVPGIFFALLLLARSYFANRPGPWRPFFQKFGTKSVIAVSALLGICVILVPVFEAYFRIMECEVSDAYKVQNIDLAQRTMAVLMLHKIPFWLDYATLLNELRGQQLNRWEQDVDLSIIRPEHMQSLRNMPVYPDGSTMASNIDRAKANPNENGVAITTEDLIDKFQMADFVVTHLPDRSLIQLWNKSKRGPHVDLWLWSACKPGACDTTPAATPSATLWAPETNEPILWSMEEITYNDRLWKEMFPLRNSQWLDRPVMIPNDKDAISQKEYGRYGGSYKTAQVFRGDCFHNFFQLKYFYRG